MFGSISWKNSTPDLEVLERVLLVEQESVNQEKIRVLELEKNLLQKEIGLGQRELSINKREMEVEILRGKILEQKSMNCYARDTNKVAVVDDGSLPPFCEAFDNLDEDMKERRKKEGKVQTISPDAMKAMIDSWSITRPAGDGLPPDSEPKKSIQ